MTSNHKRLAASTLLFNVRIAKDEATAQFVLGPVHLAADDAEERLAVDQDLDPILFHGLVKGPRFVDVFEVVRQTAAAPVLDSNPDELWIWLIQKLAEMVHRCWCQAHGSLPRP